MTPISKNTQGTLDRQAVQATFHAFVHEQVRQAIRATFIAILEDQITQFIAAAPYERSTQRRDQRAGHRSRTLATTAGVIDDLPLPRTRAGFRTQLFGRYQRRMAEIDDLMRGMFVAGVSQRMVGTLVEHVSGTRPSPSTVSRVFHTLEAEFAAWQKRALPTRYVYVFADGTYFSVIYDGQGQKMPILALIGITAEGQHEVIAFTTGERENQGAWENLLADIKARGVQEVGLWITDGHQAMLNAIELKFPTSKRQRCIKHKMENILSHVPEKQRELVRQELRAIFYQKNRAQADLLAAAFTEKYRTIYPSAIACMERDWEACLTFYAFPELHSPNIRTTNIIEIVFSQVRKADVGTRFRGWDHIANFDLIVGYDHTIDQQFDQRTPLGKGRLRQSSLEAFTQRLDGGNGGARLVELFTHVRQLPCLDLQVVALLHQLALTAFEFRQFKRFREIRGQKTILLAVETAECLLDGGVAMLDLLREPCPALRPLQRQRNQLGMLHHGAEILPDQRLQLIGRDIARRTALVMTTADRILFAATQIIAIVGESKVPLALQVTLPTLHQRAQQVVVPGAAPRGLLIGRQAGLHPIEHLLSDDRRDGDANPVLCWRERPTLPRPNRLKRRFAARGWAGADAVRTGAACIAGIEQDQPHGVGGPMRHARGRPHLPPRQAERQLVETDATVGIGLKQLLDNGRLNRIDGEQAGIPRAFGMSTVAVGYPAPWEQLATADLRLTAAPHPLGN